MKKKNQTAIGIGLLFLEVTLLFAFFSFAPSSVIAAIGNPNATVQSWLDVGNTYPEVVYVSINNDDAAITLTPNATTLVSCVGVIMEFNGDSDVQSANATFYDSSSSHGAANDNNDHYTNSSCELIADTGGFKGYADDPYYSLANCTFEVEYYANADTWTCNLTAVDNMSWTDSNYNTTTVSQLLALGVPNIINYSTVNATYVSAEQVANVTNYGNVEINLSLEGYGVSSGDGLAMNCILGNVGTIPSMYEKYNLTATTPGTQTLTQFETNYINISATGTPDIKQFNLGQRTNDTAGGESIKESYWRIYVPKGVAGTCNGTIIFGATTAAGS